MRLGGNPNSGQLNGTVSLATRKTTAFLFGRVSPLVLGFVDDSEGPTRMTQHCCIRKDSPAVLAQRGSSWKCCKRVLLD